ncbi:PapB/FocB family fimbrial expression transcriptional regulator [Yokenella regensburgei]|uniref:PapB/FocB family fimbrial expression transcriptional regulator n=1 Tax=Yokenella regensburgei TaxID=158877 RepID=UPI0027D934C6|nr:PapB/FocB family fimbrial expression transcriptional regulator [Yokenella regensburgei]MDQ4429047.1 PapB/FocB family fimbrial expression transcriptional regulator [Yokenella regensburgei]
MSSLLNGGKMFLHLRPGEVSDEMFYSLIDLSSIRSEKVVNALRDHFVESKRRVDVCSKYNVNPGYLSIKIKELQGINSKAINYYQHYNQKMGVTKIS